MHLMLFVNYILPSLIAKNYVLQYFLIDERRGETVVIMTVGYQVIILFSLYSGDFLCHRYQERSVFRHSDGLDDHDKFMLLYTLAVNPEPIVLQVSGVPEFLFTLHYLSDVQLNQCFYQALE